jgi:hypothetical protein
MQVYGAPNSRQSLVTAWQGLLPNDGFTKGVASRFYYCTWSEFPVYERVKLLIVGGVT